MENFQKDFRKLSNNVFPEKKKDFQDHRAILVYLTLMYPERYFFYKYGMFEKFAERIDYAHKPSIGKVENIGLYQNLCELVRYEIQKDQELLNLHEKRLDKKCYRDKDYNVLTQDFIYAVTQYFDRIIPPKVSPKEIVEETEISTNELETKIVSIR